MNLLPEKDLKRLKLMRLRRLLVFRILLISAYGLLIVGVLWGAEILIQREADAVVEKVNVQKSEESAARFLVLQEKIQEFNRNLTQAARVQQDQVVLSPLLVEIALLTPAEVRLTDLQISQEENRGFVRGVALTRESLLVFEREMRSSDFFLEIESPLSNLTSKENVEFGLKFIFDQEKLEE